MKMKMRCISRCQFKGAIVHVGQELDMDETTLGNDPIAKSSFAPTDPTAAKTRSESVPIVAGLTRRQTLLKLASAKVPCDDTMSDEELARRFGEAFDSKKAHSLKN